MREVITQDLTAPVTKISASKAASLPYLLINPPLTDPTVPYHSLPYLVGATGAWGFTGYRCLDANIDSLNFLARPENVGALLGQAARTRRRIESAQVITGEDEILYQVALAAEGLAPDFISRAIEVFRDPELFYHYPTYREAALAMTRWQTLLSLEGLPLQYANFEVRAGGLANLGSVRDMGDRTLIERITRPFDPYINGPFADILHSQPWALIGFSVNYTGQLPFALRLAARARTTCPDAVIVFGGTEVCDDVRFGRETGTHWRIFADADVIVPGEGETPLCRILGAIAEDKPLSGIPGVLIRDDPAAGQSPGMPTSAINYENIATLPSPDYSVWDWDAYWSPEPVVLYSPTRGCYWNKCTFCDYGLNTDRPTSPSRDRPVERVLSDLAEISKIGQLVYFAVDAMSPRYLRALCQELSQSDVSIRWAAELRLERTFPKRDMAQLLKASGCLAISFGYESGSQRILDLIDKGTQIAEVPKILAELGRYGIGAQMMGFTGFPSETHSEAEQTYLFLHQHRDLWAVAAIGKFDLTPGAIVARQPERFGITLLKPPSSDDIIRSVPWLDNLSHEEHWPAAADDCVRPEVRSVVKRGLQRRPFVGGVDAGHTMMYFRRYGRALVPTSQDEPPLVRLVPPAEREIPFSSIADFLPPLAIDDHFLDIYPRGEATSEYMLSWLQAPGSARRGAANVFILPVGVPVPIPANSSAALRDAVLVSAKAHGAA
jgi:anaerobic magnesium-protoporphyrin IX monomethyl ester cyclase